MLEILEEADFVTQEFILTPLQFGVPYSRPRYFCLVRFLCLSFPVIWKNMGTITSTVCSNFGLLFNLYQFPL